MTRYTASPHAADLDAFASMLVGQGYKDRAPERHTRRLLQALQAADLPPNAIVGTDQLRDAFAAWPAKGYVGTYRLFRRYLHERGRLGPSAPCQPRYRLKDEHLRRLVDLQGLAPATVVYDNWALTDFLTRVLEPDELPSSITAAKLEAFFRSRGTQLARRTFHHSVHVIRRYLRHAFDAGALPVPLHEFELPRQFRFEQPPRALDPGHVQALLASIDRGTRVGRRDHALLHLMARYGLRPGEVATLTREAVDWQACTLRIEQSKTRSVLLLPMAPHTMHLLREFVDRCGPASGQAPLFAAAHPPFGAMTQCAVSTRFKVHARRSGLPIAHASAYALRHSFAMRLLGAGVGVKLIGDLLGHRSLASTSAYLRIQTEMLRDAALDVPMQVTP
ncbi:MAG: tyrosine-type recombinase/integrase [Burkholderiaceae bacterium]|nr:tyrosine-type recombinase/integrase [Burkholderiaceae bacterium]